MHMLQKYDRSTDKRDVRVAFAIVTALVLLLGALSSIAFNTDDMQQNFVLSFPRGNVYAATAKLAVVLAIFGSFLSMLSILRLTVL
jgi:hypothetical protein